METPRGGRSAKPVPQGACLPAGRRSSSLPDGQCADHPRLLMPWHVAVVLVGTGRGVNHRLLGGPWCDVDADTQLVDAEVVRGRPFVEDPHCHISIARDAQLLRLEVDVVGIDLNGITPSGGGLLLSTGGGSGFRR